MATEQEQKEASAKIAEKLEEIKRLTKECESIADTAGVSFSWPKPAYGMGGYYTSKQEYIRDCLDPDDPDYEKAVKRIMASRKSDYDSRWGWSHRRG